jgi:hypothetical protein
MKFGIFVAAGMLALSASAFAASGTRSAVATVSVVIDEYVNVTWAPSTNFNFGTMVPGQSATKNGAVVVASNVNGHIEFTPGGTTLDTGWNKTISGLVNTNFIAGATTTMPVSIFLAPDLTVAPGPYSATITATAFTS